MKKNPRKAIRPYRDNYTESIYQPYATALGQATMAWNDLCEVQAGLFWTILGGGLADVPLAVWNAIKSDRAQREMLRAAAAAAFPKGGGTRLQTKYPQLAQDIEWLLNEIGKVEDVRNDIVHAPLASAGAGEDAVVLPATAMRNNRSKKLDMKNAKGKRLLAKYRWCRDMGLVLREFCWQIDHALCREPPSWPGRPSLPRKAGSLHE